MTGVKSKPVYAELGFDVHARRHLLVAEGEGADALLRVWGQAQAAGGDCAEALEAIYLARPGADRGPALREQLGDRIEIASEFNTLKKRLARRLAGARMGTRLYLAGSEAFIWGLIRRARLAGLDEDEIQRERCGSLARPTVCVHCRTALPSVKTNIYTCPGCGLYVFVRDHFSRRLGAYQSVCVDAEAPGDVPAIEEVYP